MNRMPHFHITFSSRITEIKIKSNLPYSKFYKVNNNKKKQKQKKETKQRTYQLPNSRRQGKTKSSFSENDTSENKNSTIKF